MRLDSKNRSVHKSCSAFGTLTLRLKWFLRQMGWASLGLSVEFCEVKCSIVTLQSSCVSMFWTSGFNSSSSCTVQFYLASDMHTRKLIVLHHHQRSPIRIREYVRAKVAFNQQGHTSYRLRLESLRTAPMIRLPNTCEKIKRPTSYICAFSSSLTPNCRSGQIRPIHWLCSGISSTKKNP